MQVTKPNAQELALINVIDEKMQPIQSELDALNFEMKAALMVVDEIKVRILAVKPKLVPLAEMRAGLANINSRNKYFPEFLGRFDNVEKKAEFIAYVEGQVNG